MTNGGRREAMGGFVEATLEFPTVLFSFLLLIVVAYWVLVLTGTTDVEDADGFGDFLGGLGLGGAPVAVVGSILIAVAWFASLVGGVLFSGPVLAAVALVIAVLLAWLCTRLLMVPLRKVFRAGPEASRNDFVGGLCVIRTGRVSASFGQAEVTAADGSSAIVQVRQAGEDPLRAGSQALIYDYDVDGEFFWVTPVAPHS
ncbi:hypothetical protein [Micromonospora sp. CPCC 206061]|uniref:hypothetical protein n=1 Tax=Micromonospora sp. CPCC 206061 TaxID=3122410 RepID=UPI002FF2B6F5